MIPLEIVPIEFKHTDDSQPLFRLFLSILASPSVMFKVDLGHGPQRANKLDSPNQSLTG